jgi:O-antigen ligase
MFADHPLGVGAGSFYTAVGSYDPLYVGRDCHNTYIRCAAELGFPGILVFLALIVNAFLMLRRIPSLALGTPIEKDIRWDCLGLQVAFVVYLTAGFFMGLTYLEEFWWFFCLPVCLERAARNASHAPQAVSGLVKMQAEAA